MTRAFRYRDYGVFVYDERGQPHHRAHAHIKKRGQRVASIFLETLDLYHDTERLPRDLKAEIEKRQEDLLDLWQELNGDG